jgi:leucine dehydrogenase
MASIEEISVQEHECVSIFKDRSAGLTAIIAVHDTTLGPGLGGCRMKMYDSLDEAMYDVLRLSQGMTYKNALAGLPLGGGKSVIIKDNTLEEGREEFFLAFGRCVAAMNGKYITAEDIGTRVSDMEAVLKVCDFVTGRDPAKGGAGDPSPFTAQGVFEGMRACLEAKFDSASFSGKHVAIQGVGSVGHHLARHLVEAGARITIADPNESQLAAVVSELGAEVVSLDDIYSVDCDIFAPCAIGATINERTIPQLSCSIVAGAANNQLVTEEIESELAARSILYAPDFALNAGGVIMCADELEADGFNAERVRGRVSGVYDTLVAILKRAKSENAMAGQVAVQLAKDRIEAARRG